MSSKRTYPISYFVFMTTGVWISHSIVMIDVIKKYKIRRFAELGVDHGSMTATILDTIGNQIDEYWGIDLWKPWRSKHTLESMDNLYWRSCKKMLQYPNFRLIRMDATKAASLFPDGYFDGIFHDTSHHYEATASELDVWAPKVHKGGIIAGHDYHDHFKGVTQAVDERFSEITLYPDSTYVKEVV